MPKIILTILILIFSFSIIIPELIANDNSNKDIKVVYQKRQKIDLEDISIQGEFVTPGDFSVEDEKQNGSEMIYKRKNYNDRLPITIEYIY